MRKISIQAGKALLAKTKYNSGNTRVATYVDSNMLPYEITEMYLHGNTIAKLKGNKLTLTCAGWGTPTTKERLNTILELANISEVGFRTRKGQLYYGTEAIDSDTEIEIDI